MINSAKNYLGNPFVLCVPIKKHRDDFLELRQTCQFIKMASLRKVHSIKLNYLLFKIFTAFTSPFATDLMI